MPSHTRHFLKSCALFLVLLYSAAGAIQAQELEVIPLWPGAAPGSESVTITEKEVERSKDPAVRDRAYVAITKPTLTRFPVRNPNGTSLIVMPGGAYERVVFDKEGGDLAEIFGERGVIVFILKYRLPAEGHANRQWVPLQDVQRAVRVVRSNAAKWGLDPDRVGVMGFSAGGHLAATSGTLYERNVYAKIDAADDFSARPDFQALLYPVVSLDEKITHALSGENLLGPAITADMRREMSAECNVTANTPPAFIVHANDDDAVPAENSLRLYLALRQAGVPVQLVVFAEGGHGFGIRNARGKPAEKWPELFLDWLTGLKKKQ